MLRYVAGFDLVGDESKRDHVRFGRENPPPGQWTSERNPPYSYQLFYFFANMAVLNQFRKMRGMNTFTPPSALWRSWFTQSSDRWTPVLNYLYYLTQIPITMAPASNNKRFALLADNPFPQYFKQGLVVSFSTDDPLQFHLSKEGALAEEYAMAHHLWKFNHIDLCEIARSSVLLSGFPHAMKQHWLGEKYVLEGPSSHDCTRTNIPEVRMVFRYETLAAELKKIFDAVEETQLEGWYRGRSIKEGTRSVRRRK